MINPPFFLKTAYFSITEPIYHLFCRWHPKRPLSSFQSFSVAVSPYIWRWDFSIFGPFLSPFWPWFPDNRKHGNCSHKQTAGYTQNCGWWSYDDYLIYGSLHNSRWFMLLLMLFLFMLLSFSLSHLQFDVFLELCFGERRAAGNRLGFLDLFFAESRVRTKADCRHREKVSARGRLLDLRDDFSIWK